MILPKKILSVNIRQKQYEFLKGHILSLRRRNADVVVRQTRGNDTKCCFELHSSVSKARATLLSGIQT